MKIRMFKPQFAPLVQSGAKRQTIRPIPKRMPRVGGRESWRQWIGKPYRSKTLELAQVEIVYVGTIKIEMGGDKEMITFAITTEKSFNLTSPDAFVRADGFSGIDELLQWFDKTHGLPFSGILIRAKDLK